MGNARSAKFNIEREETRKTSTRQKTRIERYSQSEPYDPVRSRIPSVYAESSSSEVSKDSDVLSTYSTKDSAATSRTETIKSRLSMDLIEPDNPARRSMYSSRAADSFFDEIFAQIEQEVEKSPRSPTRHSARSTPMTTPKSRFGNSTFN
ncbi:predicted protein [Nematostella vectensis]|uniref:Uncharacterized protein n=1 Tax=Nematostella vectensis TaxID=45351 RepID=A7RX48_NEMVE|nr:predicted protein [Nematostella vectensis]|eukprot:XP_001636033.1 predicted protein [Nematostella vectensis]